MNSTKDDQLRLIRMEKILTGLLKYGSIFASVWITIGMILSMARGGSSNDHDRLADQLMGIGVVLLIALPVARVALIFMIFLFERDYIFAVISGTVLLIIATGFLAGVLASHITLM